MTDEIYLAHFIQLEDTEENVEYLKNIEAGLYINESKYIT